MRAVTSRIAFLLLVSVASTLGGQGQAAQVEELLAVIERVRSLRSRIDSVIDAAAPGLDSAKRRARDGTNVRQEFDALRARLTKELSAGTLSQEDVNRLASIGNDTTNTAAVRLLAATAYREANRLRTSRAATACWPSYSELLSVREVVSDVVGEVCTGLQTDLAAIRIDMLARGLKVDTVFNGLRAWRDSVNRRLETAEAQQWSLGDRVEGVAGTSRATLHVVECIRDRTRCKTTGPGTQPDSRCSMRWFKDTRYFDPLIADPRAAQLNAIVWSQGTAVADLQKPQKTRRYWDIDVGSEFPIVSRLCGAEIQGRPAQGAFGFGVWFNVAFHMLEDHLDDSAPIINTDYRFAFANVKAQYGLDAHSSVGARVMIGHESTHLGDEYTIAARRSNPGFRRINVSYEWMDVGGSYEFRDGQSTVRAGVITTIPFSDTYYTTDSLEAPGPSVVASANALEPYAGFQWVSGFTNRRLTNVEWYLSVDARLKTVYDYDRTDASASEDRQASFNVLLGLAPLREARAGGVRASPYLRFYSGVNPHGQFRAQRDFRLIGIGVRLDR